MLFFPHVHQDDITLRNMGKQGGPFLYFRYRLKRATMNTSVKMITVPPIPSIIIWFIRSLHAFESSHFLYGEVTSIIFDNLAGKTIAKMK